MNPPDICLYHRACQDGFAAAWAVYRKFGPQVIYEPVGYDEAPPDVTDKHVVIVDFSYPAEILTEIGRKASSVLVLDHHKSAAEALRHLEEPPPTWLEWYADVTTPSTRRTVAALFDMDRSGARMAWDYFHPGEDLPTVIKHVEDRDLWRFRQPDTKTFCAALASYPFEFGTWDRLARQAETHTGFSDLALQGAAIERKQMRDIEDMLDLTARWMEIGGVLVPAANLPKLWASDAAGALAEGRPFAAVYFDRSDGRREFSLRSRDGGMDVSEIAKRYGGGGHARAAGFIERPGWEGDGA